MSQNSLKLQMQCLAWVNPVIPKGAFAGKTYASKFDNKKPSLCRVYVMGANGELVHKDWQKS
jgi:hypothetical protein